MPDTQQEWIIEQLAASAQKRGSFNMQLLFLDSKKPTSSAIALASDLASAWPSSPQGLATKALMDVLRQVRVREIEWSMDTRAQLGPGVDRALDAARKAGL